MVEFSHSVLECFNSCRRLYYYRYIERLDVKKNVYASLGMILHTMFERFYRINFESQKSFLKQYAHEWAKACNDQDCNDQSDKIRGIWVYNEGEKDKILDSFFWVGWHILTKFYNKHKDKRGELEDLRKRLKDDLTKRVEEEFLQQSSLFRITKKELKDKTRHKINKEYESAKKVLFPRVEELIKFKWMGYNLVAKIDRIDKSDGGFVVTDYKTGKHLDGPFKDHQFTVYYLAILNKFGKPPKGMIKSHLRSGQDKIIVVGEEQFQYLKNDLDQANNFLEDIDKALKIRRKIRRKKSHTLKLSLFDDDKDILDIKRFKPRQDGQCFYCDYHNSCSDQLNGRETELKKINNISDLEDRIESFWNEIDFE